MQKNYTKGRNKTIYLGDMVAQVDEAMNIFRSYRKYMVSDTELPDEVRRFAAARTRHGDETKINYCEFFRMLFSLFNSLPGLKKYFLNYRKVQSLMDKMSNAPENEKEEP